MQIMPGPWARCTLAGSLWAPLRSSPRARAQQALALLAAQEGDVLHQVCNALLPLPLIHCSAARGGAKGG